MGSIHRELDKIKYDIMRQRGLVQCLRRQIRRVDGKEVIRSTREADENRLRDECAFDSWDLTRKSCLSLILKNQEAVLNRLIARRNVLKHELETRLPLTPCGMVIAIIKAKRKRELRKYASKHLPQ